MTSREDAVSEAIGGVLLIALVVIGAAIVGTYVASQPLPEKIPKVQFGVKEYQKNIYLEHEGGESLINGSFSVVVDGQRIPPGKWEIVSGDDTWNLGDRIKIDEEYEGAKSVGLVYSGGSGETLLRSSSSPWGFEYSPPFPDPFEVIEDPYEVRDIPDWPGNFTNLSYDWPVTAEPQPTFTPANSKHVYVAAKDSTITPPEPPLFICDGVDDEREINDAIAIAQGGVVELLDGTFRCHGRIILRDDTSLYGQGSLDTAVEITAKNGGSGYLPVTINANNVNVGYFSLHGNGFVMVTKSHVRVHDITATSIDLDGKWHKASGNGMFFVWVAPPEIQVDDVEFYLCRAVRCHTHGFNMNQYYDDRVVRATTNIRFVGCHAVKCGYGVAGEPGIPASVTSTNESRSEWITGFDFHEWQDLVNCEVVECVAADNWESGFHLEPGARYTEPPGPWTVSKNIVFRDCASIDNGQRNTYKNHFFMSGYYLSRDTDLHNCYSENNRNCGYYVHSGKDSSFTDCRDVGSTYGWKVCKASEDISIADCTSENNPRWALWLSFSKRISVTNFVQSNVAGDRGYQNILGWYKDEAKYQLPVTDSKFVITAYGNTMPIINRAGNGNTYDLSYG
ncbi:MAG: type IV pilin [Methanospirillum sp.]|nr:type IV pilin [Methanospirillum sp.]